jgi:hypothetical protein
MRATLGLMLSALAVCVTAETARVLPAELRPASQTASPRASPAAAQAPLLGSPAARPRGAKPFAGDAIYQTTTVHKIHISMSAAEWAVLQTSSPRGSGVVGGSDYRDNTGRLVHSGSGFAGYFPWVKSDVRIADAAGAVAIKDAGLRYKGNLSFMRSSAAAPLFANMKLKFDVHGTKGTWDGEKTFNLHAGVVDTSKMRDAVAYAIFRASGVPAPRRTLSSSSPCPACIRARPQDCSR